MVKSGQSYPQLKMKTSFLLPILILFHCGALFSAGQDRPNIVYILADDLGYGDVSSYNSGSKIRTPHIDRLATQGMRFTDAHSPSGVCTPTRYGVLTGRYSWRTRLKSGVLGGYSTPMIPPSRVTVAAMLKARGYRTAVIGKWHLGMNFATTDFNPPNNVASLGGAPTNIYWAGEITDGPTARGFDHFFGCSASWDMPPYAWIKDDRFVAAEMVTAPRRPEQLSPTRSVFGRGGAMSPGMTPEAAMPMLAKKAVAYVHAAADRNQPFFLYIPLTAPHTPVAPNEAFRGQSEAGLYGDFVIETDWLVGQVMQALEASGLAKDTLLIFTSDNGPENPMHQRKTEFGHYGAAHFRGNKRDNWEGGHRMPFIARWPGKIAASTISDEITCLTDLIATCADVVGYRLPADVGEDSYSLLPTLLGEKVNRPIREGIVHHSSSGKFAIRQGRWKLLLHAGSGGNDSNYQRLPEYAHTFETDKQLYDLIADPGETRNLATANPEIVNRLTNTLRRFVVDGRSTPGPRQSNDTADDWAQLAWMKR